MIQLYYETAAACIGSLGFAMLFNLRGRRLLWCAFGGGMSWAVYIFCMLIMGAGLYTSLFFASAAVVALAEILARRIKTPVTVLMVPMIIPLIPGGTLYYAMSYLLEIRYELFAREARSLTLQVFAIALGIIITTSLSRAVFTVIYRLKEK